MSLWMGLLLLAIEGTAHFPELAIIMPLTHRESELLPDDCPVASFACDQTPQVMSA